MSELDKIFLPLVGTLLIGVLTWFLNTLLKLRQEFDTHREGKGHKLLVDAFFQLEKELAESKSETKGLLTERIASLAEELNKSITDSEKRVTERSTSLSEELNRLISQLDKRIEVNFTKIDGITKGLQDLAGTTKYSLRSVEDRLFLVEEILRSKGYSIINYTNRRKTLASAEKDTFTQVEEMGEGDID